MQRVSSMREALELFDNEEYGLCELYDSYEDRLYRVEKNPIGLFKTDTEVLYGEDSEFVSYLPKVEPVIWLRIVHFFKEMAKYNVEAAVNLFWDMEKKKYFLYVPKQYVTSVTCNIEYTEEWQQIASKYLFVAEIHSHHRMAAQFSSIDDDDEKGTRIFGVWGNYIPANEDETKDFSCFTFRAGCGGTYARIRIEDFLDGYYSRQHEYLPRIAYESMLKPVHIVQQGSSRIEGVI